MLKTYKKYYKKIFNNELLTVLFVASLFFLIHHKTTLFTPFDFITLHLNINILSSPKIIKNNEDLYYYKGSFLVYKLEKHLNSKTSPIVLIYDQNIYDKKFNGISPLDRCILAEDFSSIFKENPKIVAVDIDLSPLEKPRQRNKCQEKLDNILIKNANKTKIVLIKPLRISNITEKWMAKMKKNNISFADSIITSSLGIVLNRSLSPDSLGQVVYEKILNKKTHINKTHHSEFHILPINYTEAGHFKIATQGISLKDKVLFIGGSYGIEDKFLTPLDENVPGVMIHAYDYFSAIHPVKTTGIVNLIAYTLDVVFAITVGFIMKKLWGIYINLLKKQIKSSYLFFLFIFFILFVFIVIGILVASYMLKFNIWISPIPIIIAVFFDGIVNSLIEQFKEQNKEYKYAKNINKEKISIFTNIFQLLDKTAFYIKNIIMLSIVLYSFYYISVSILH